MALPFPTGSAAGRQAAGEEGSYGLHVSLKTRAKFPAAPKFCHPHVFCDFEFSQVLARKVPATGGEW
jgi:hypothetical protein